MWESPVNIYETISDMVEKEIEENIIIEIKRQLGIDINKEELIKALQYDRNQYDKGYQDGLNADRWISIKDKLPDEEGQYLCITEPRHGRIVDIELFCSGGFISRNKITHWMPLPAKPYKVESESQES